MIVSTARQVPAVLPTNDVLTCCRQNDVLLTCKEQMAVLFGEDSEDESMEDEDETSGNLVE